jgi:hypothetical protein
MRHKRTLASVTAIVVAVALLARAQAPAVSGRVIAEDTHDPVPNARVTVSSGALGAPVVLTDAGGHFALPVAGDRSTVVASKTGYARSDATPTAGKAIEIRLRQGAVISGRVVDEDGDPVPNARGSAEIISPSAATPATAGVSTRDDRGEYRLSGLPAGAFAVAVLRITLAATIGRIAEARGRSTIQARQT